MSATLKWRRGWTSGRMAAVDWRHPLAQGLTGLGVSNYVVTYPGRVGSSVLVGSPYGPGWNCPAGGGLPICVFPQQNDATCFTFLGVALMPTADNYGAIVGNRLPSTPVDFAKLCGNVAPGSATLAYYSGGVDRSLIDPTGTGNGQWNVLAATKKGLALTLYKNGAQVLRNIYTSGQLSWSSTKTCYYGVDSSGDTANKIAMGGFWDTRALSDAEIAEISADPFAFLIEPGTGRRRVS